MGHETGTLVSRLELARRNPSFEAACALEFILGVAPSELFPGLYTRVKKEVVDRARTYYDDLQGDSSRDNVIKLDFLEEMFARADRHTAPRRA